MTISFVTVNVSHLHELVYYSFEVSPGAWA